MKYTEEELCIIWLDSFTGLENRHKRELYGHIKDADGIKSVVEKSRDYIVENCDEKTFDTLTAAANNSYLEFVLSALEKSGIKAVTAKSEEYPTLLKETPCPPLVLYAKGNISLLKSDCFSIVGSRKSLPISIKFAEDYSAALGKEFTLVTGIAEGVDAAVLSSALKTGANAISVVAGGLNSVYPKENYALFTRVAESGLAISEFPPEVAPLPYFFPARNRIIAGLSKGTLIISGGKKSGTLYTAGYAADYGRDVFAVPYTPDTPSGAGCNDLIKQGATITTEPADILGYYGKEEKKEKQDLSPEEQTIANALKDGEKHVDKICALTGKEIYEITPILSMLEIKGVIVKSGINVYGLTRKYSEE